MHCTRVSGSILAPNKHLPLSQHKPLSAHLADARVIASSDAQHLVCPVAVKPAEQQGQGICRISLMVTQIEGVIPCRLTHYSAGWWERGAWPTSCSMQMLPVTCLHCGSAGPSSGHMHVHVSGTVAQPAPRTSTHLEPVPSRHPTEKQTVEWVCNKLTASVCRHQEQPAGRNSSNSKGISS